MATILTSFALLFTTMNTDSTLTWNNITRKTWVTCDIGVGARMVFYQTKMDEKRALLSFDGSGVYSIGTNCYSVIINGDSIDLKGSMAGEGISYMSLNYNAEKDLLISHQQKITFKVLLQEPEIYFPPNEKSDMEQLINGAFPCN